MSETNSPLPTVFVMQHPTPKAGWTPNLEPATQYGKLEFVFDAEDRPNASPQAAIAKAKKRLATFDASRDYLLWPNFGDMASMWVIIALLTNGGNKCLRYLYWAKGRKSALNQGHDKDGYYYPVEINLATSY